jgi:hypothetical protein
VFDHPLFTPSYFFSKPGYSVLMSSQSPVLLDEPLGSSCPSQTASSEANLCFKMAWVCERRIPLSIRSRSP